MIVKYNLQLEITKIFVRIKQNEHGLIKIIGYIFFENLV